MHYEILPSPPRNYIPQPGDRIVWNDGGALQLDLEELHRDITFPKDRHTAHFILRPVKPPEAAAVNNVSPASNERTPDEIIRHGETDGVKGNDPRGYYDPGSWQRILYRHGHEAGTRKREQEAAMQVAPPRPVTEAGASAPMGSIYMQYNGETWVRKTHYNESIKELRAEIQRVSGLFAEAVEWYKALAECVDYRCDHEPWPLEAKLRIEARRAALDLRTRALNSAGLPRWTVTGHKLRRKNDVSTPMRAKDVSEQERYYQENKFPDHRHTPGEWIILLMALAGKAMGEWKDRGDLAAMHEIRQITATGLAAMEQCGAYPRAEPGEALAAVTSPAPPENTASPEPNPIELAWGIIANAGGGNWDKESHEWNAAAKAWRDKYITKKGPAA